MDSVIRYLPIKCLPASHFSTRMRKIVFHSLLNFTQLTQWFYVFANPNVVACRSQIATDFAHPKICRAPLDLIVKLSFLFDSDMFRLSNIYNDAGALHSTHALFTLTQTVDVDSTRQKVDAMTLGSAV